MYKATFSTVIGFLVVCLAFGKPVLAQDDDPRQDIEGQRLAQTGMKFLSMSVDARYAALGSAVTAIEGSSSSLFYNPASMTAMEHGVGVSLGNVNWIADINYNVGSAAYRIGNGRYGVVGVSIETVDYGDVLSTIRADNEKGFRDVGSISPTSYAAGIGYARNLSSRVAVGGHVKYVSQSLGASVVNTTGDDGTNKHQHDVSTAAVDLGVLYRTGFRSLNFAVSVRNFSRELTYAEDSFELPLTMLIGFSMDVVDLTGFSSDMHSALLTLDAVRSRDYPEQLKAGFEYTFLDVLSLRAGYALPTDVQGVNLGAGLKYGFGNLAFGFDYAYTNFSVFQDVHRVGIRVAGF